MPTSRRAGGISKRCECRGPDGKRLGAACPLLSKRAHGKHRVSQELPPTAEGKRRQFQRTGYATAGDAQKDLSRIQALLDLAPDDEDAQCRIGDLLAELMGSRGPIPEPADVTRRIGAGVPLNGSTTVGDWLDSWVAKKKASKKRKTATGYESHVRVHIKPAVGHIRMDRFNVGHAQAMFDAIDEANETILAENQARREQSARCTRGKPGAPKASERAQLEAERVKLAEMPPFRKVTGPATKQRIRSTLRAALNAAISAQLITFNAASHVELAPGRRPKGLLWT
ncbi:site-specific integrase, partial [Streptomyces sp. NPDC059346]